MILRLFDTASLAEAAHLEVDDATGGVAFIDGPESLREIVTGDIPRKPQALMTSSRTKWSRMTFGTLPSSKWQ